MFLYTVMVSTTPAGFKSQKLKKNGDQRLSEMLEKHSYV